MIRMRVTARRLTYDTRRMVAGDVFLARDGDARALEYIRKAEKHTDQTVKLAGRRSDELDNLRSMAVALGFPIDRRWGAKRLKQEIESRKAS